MNVCEVQGTPAWGLGEGFTNPLRKNILFTKRYKGHRN